MLPVDLLARIQFALTVSFHYVFPPISIGLGLMLVLMEGLYLKTRNPKYKQMTLFWVKLFGLIFGIGVATGIVMEFQFGTNWATYSRYVGDVFGSALAAEGIFAFFLESGFLAILLFGWNKVGPRMHFFSTLMVALGAMFSALWIVVANSWQQTPAGFHLVETIVGNPLSVRAEVTDFWAMVLNPSSMARYAHVVFGAWTMGATLVMSVSAWYLLKKREPEIAKMGMKLGLGVLTLACALQAITGHWSAEIVAKYQPLKLAAMEGHYAASAPADLYLGGWVDDASQKVTGLKIAGGTSALLHQGDFKAPIKGLNSEPNKALRPPVWMTFQCYHLMLYCAAGLVSLCLVGWWLALKGKLYDNRLFLKLCVAAVVLPQLGNQAGWFAAEVGRQPWIVYGLLKTSDALSKVVSANQVVSSIILFTLIYILLFILFVYLLNAKIQAGPEAMLEAMVDPSLDAAQSRREQSLRKGGQE